MDHVTKAVQYFENGYMCSQAVFAAFAEQFGITEKQALQISACFGGGCTSCKKFYENTKKAVAESGITADVAYITDMETVMSYGVMRMPALVVNEQIAAMGKVMKPAEIVKLLEKVSG